MKTHTLILTALMLALAAPAAAYWPTTVQENVIVIPDTGGLECYTLPYPDNSTLVFARKGWIGPWYQIVDRFGNFVFPYGQSATPANMDIYVDKLQLIPDDQGGAYLCWTTQYTNPVQGIIAQHLDSLGNRLWGDSGVIVFPVQEQDFSACSDNQGGFIIAVSPNEQPGGAWTDLYAQRIDAQGNLLWGPGGVLVSGIPDSDERDPRVTPDGSGGCFIVWEDSRTPNPPFVALYAQHLDGNGSRLWAQDLYICNHVYHHKIIPDGQGGFILLTNPGGSIYDTCYRVNGNGSILWSRDHVSWNQGKLVSGEPGFFYLGFNVTEAFYGQRMDINGNFHWPSWPAAYGALMYSRPNWVLLGDRRFFYQFPYFYGMFGELPTGTYNVHLIAQKLDTLGNRLLGESGVDLTWAYMYWLAGQFMYQNVRADNEGGFTAVWELFIGQVGGYIYEVCAKHVNEDGSLGGPFPLDVTLAPHNPPIQIPASGGTFTFDVAIADTDSVGGTMDVWIEVTLPNGSPLGILARNDLTIQPNGTLIRNNLQQFVPAGAPAGTYTYTLYAGDHDYNSPSGQDSFTFEKLGARGWGQVAGNSEWTLDGWDEPSVGAQRAVPMPKPVD